jgi:tetratricopeptide (TPR) repeat protein
MTRYLAGKQAAILAAALLVSNTAFSSECTPPPQLQASLRAHPTAENYAALGEYFGNKDEHACAAQAFASALKLEPRSAKFSYLLGLNLYAAGQTEPAADALQQSIQLNPTSLQAHLLLATVLDQLHRGQEAEAQWRAALDIDPSSALALDGLAKFLLASHQYPAVVQLLHPAARDENLALDLAIAYDHTGKLDEATATLTQALAAAPSSLPLANALALAYIKQDRHQDAARLLEKQYALHPDDAETQLDYFRVLVVNEEREKALPLGKTLLAKLPHDFNVLYLNGVLEREGGDYAAARDHLEEAVQLNPNHPDCRYNLGVVLARLNQPAEARDQFEKALALGWIGPEIHYELANVYRALGDTDLAAQQMNLYQQENHAREQRTVAASKAAQADQEMRSDDLKLATLHYREASEATPRNLLLSYKLALALDATGNTSEERTVLEKAAAIDPKYAPIQKQLGLVAAKSGDPAAAEQHFRRALQSDPNLTEAWIGLAKALATQSKIPEAKEAASHALQLEPENAQAQSLSRDLNSKSNTAQKRP